MKPARIPKKLTGLIVVTFLAALSPAVRALTINVNYDAQASSPPLADPNGTRLLAIATAAATYWEDIIEDAGTLTLRVFYQTTPGNALFSNGVEAGGRFVSGDISFDPIPSYTNPVYVPSNGWYYDPNPLDNSEYVMAQVLVRDMTGAARNAMLNGSPPTLLETSFQGPVANTAPAAAQDAADMWTYTLHEMGHALGMAGGLSTTATELSDNDYDINPIFLNGAVCASNVSLVGGAHINGTQCLMNTAIGRDNRRLPGATDVLSIATCPNPAWSLIDLQRQDFLPGGTGNWNTAGNWVGNQVPQAGDEAAVRLGTEVQAGFFTVSLAAAANCKRLLLTGATDLQTNAQKLRVVQAATVEYDGSSTHPEIFVESGGELEADDLIINGGEVDLSGGLVDIGDDLVLSADTLGRQGNLSGFGKVEVEGTLVNDGRIDATDANTLLFNSGSPSPWDLDGISGDGEVLAIQGSLSFATGSISDAFDGLLQIEDPHTVTFGEAWPLGAGGLILLNGGDPGEATLAGALLVAANGDIQATNRTRISAPVQFGGALELIVQPNSQLLLDGLTTIDGGGYLLGAGANLEFNNNTLISAGIFIIPASANVSLDGAHTLEGGSFSGLGTLRLNGTTTIAKPVTINCEILDFDGPGILAKAVHVNADLTLNSDQLDLTNNLFDSTLNLNQASTLLTVNGPASWTMDGVLNHVTGSALYFPSIDGVPFTMSGITNVSGFTRWDARATISGTINLPTGADRLALGGGDLADRNRIAGGVLSGNGALRAFNTGLTGFGTIASDLDFTTGSALLADDGLLSFSGAFLTVPPLLGTAAPDGILEVVNPWTLPPASVLGLAGGFVQGATLTNTGSVSGHGELRSNNLTNNGTLAGGNGQTLVINTTFGPDLDGTGSNAEVAGHTLNALDGNLQITKTPLDAIGAGVNIAAGRTMTFLGGWTLDTGGTLTMTGNTAANPAILAGTGAILRGSLLLDDYVRLTAAAQFENGSTTILADAGTVLRLEANASVSKGAVFSGPGRLAIAGGNTLTLGNGAAVGIAVTNDQSNLEIGASPGQAGVASYTQTSQATMVVEILGRPNTSDWDQLAVSGNAVLAGRLEVVFNAAAAEACDTWKILSAASVSGGFTEFTVTGAPAGHQILKFETPTGVYLTLSRVATFAEWAAAEGLVPGNDAVADDPDGDLVGNALEMLLGSDPEVAESGLLPGAVVATVNGIDYLSITLPLHAGNTPADLKFGAARSTDLKVWSSDNIAVESAGFNEVLCLEKKLFRSKIPFGSLPAEFLRIQITEVEP